MDTIVLKLGGSSVADNEKLKVVAKKIIKLYEKENRIVVVVSAQGKTTDNLIKEAKTLSKELPSRELDSLLSSGEQISSATFLKSCVVAIIILSFVSKTYSIVLIV